MTKRSIVSVQVLLRYGPEAFLKRIDEEGYDYDVSRVSTCTESILSTEDAASAC